MVLRKDKDQPTTVVTRTAEFLGKGDEHEELKEPYRRSILARQRRHTGVEEERRSPALSGPGQGDAATGSMKIRGRRRRRRQKLGQRNDNARKKKESVRRECRAGLFIR